MSERLPAPRQLTDMFIGRGLEKVNFTIDFRLLPNKTETLIFFILCEKSHTQSLFLRQLVFISASL